MEIVSEYSNTDDLYDKLNIAYLTINELNIEYKTINGNSVYYDKVYGNCCLLNSIVYIINESGSRFIKEDNDLDDSIILYNFLQ